MIHKTAYIMLRMTPYGESSLIVSGISRDFGKIDFFMRGARGVTKKRFPEAGLFREFEIEFREPKDGDGLASLISCVMTDFHDSLSQNTKCYFAACEHAGFLLRNSRPMLVQSKTFSAFRLMLQRMAQPSAEPEPWHTLALLAFLDENGALPRGTEGSKTDRLIDSLLNYALNADAQAPVVTSEYAKRFSAWVQELAAWNERNSR